jgi:tetratricopeptide (TPR) repeat protein
MRALCMEIGDRWGVTTATKNIGTVYLHLGRYDRTLDHYLSALAQFEELGDRDGMAKTTAGIASLYQTLGDYAKALEQHRAALALFEELGALNGIAVATGEIGSLYARKEFDGYDPVLAERYLLRAVELMKDIGVTRLLLTVHRYLETLYSQQGRWQEAHEHLVASHALNEELNTVEAHRKIQQIEHLKQIAAMEKRRALEQAQEQSEREALELRAQLLEAHLDRQRAELAAQAMSLARQTEMLGTFRNDLRAIMRDGGDPLATVKQIRERLKALPCEAIDWTKFDAEFRQTYPEFQSKLLEQYPELSGMELKICALLKLKLTSMDIAKLLCLSERSVEGHRLHIRRKMGLVKGEEVHTALGAI